MKIRKELWFGFTLMAMIIAAALYVLGSAETISRGHLGLLMLSLVVVAIMLGFPTAFTLMGMGMIFTWIAYDRDPERTLNLMVQSAFKVMSNDVLISIPLFVFMGYLVERANLIEKLFKSLHLAMARVPGSLAVATLVTCAVFATATGIVGAVVTLMGLLAFPAMLRAGYDTKLGAGAITAGGCLGILIPPSVMLIVYGATAGVSVVQLYAGAFFPGLMLAGLYVVYVIVVAWLKPSMAPPLSAEDRKVPLPPLFQKLSEQFTHRALPALLRGLKGERNLGVPTGQIAGQLFAALMPAILFGLIMLVTWKFATAPIEKIDVPASIDSVLEPGGGGGLAEPGADRVREPGSLAEPKVETLSEPKAESLSEPKAESLSEPKGGALAEPSGALAEPRPAGGAVAEPPAAVAEPATTAAARAPVADAAAQAPAAVAERVPAPQWFWITLAIGAAVLAVFYAFFTFHRLQIFKMLLASFFPLVVLILAVLGSIVFGLATPTEAAAVGAGGGYALAAVYMALNQGWAKAKGILLSWAPIWILLFGTVLWFLLYKTQLVARPVPDWLGALAAAGAGLGALMAFFQSKLLGPVRESVYLTGKTSAMVCWLFVGSSIFSAAFALLGGQELVENWVMSLNLSKTQFLILSQVLIFILGWPLEWTEIIVIFMPIFIPLLDNFGIDPLFFGLLVALNLQTAFLSPPVAMAAFYLKGVSPPHVTLNQIFLGMLPFMGIQVVAIVLLYVFPQIGLWLPEVLYGR
jgi:TRAP-type mannitol/chloroaromatic compound transport system permease large subunit